MNSLLNYVNLHDCTCTVRGLENFLPQVFSSSAILLSSNFSARRFFFIRFTKESKSNFKSSLVLPRVVVKIIEVIRKLMELRIFRTGLWCYKNGCTQPARIIHLKWAFQTAKKLLKNAYRYAIICANKWISNSLNPLETDKSRAFDRSVHCFIKMNGNNK